MNMCESNILTMRIHDDGGVRGRDGELLSRTKAGGLLHENGENRYPSTISGRTQTRVVTNHLPPTSKG